MMTGTKQMPTTLEKERQLQDEIAQQVEHALPGVDVLAVELLTPSRFRVYVDRPDGVDHALCKRVTDVLRDYLREYGIDVSAKHPDDRDWTGAEIRSCCRLAALLNIPLMEAAKHVVPPSH